MANRIILNMIVRNEGKIIERAIASARPIIDAVSICDTGSDDDTGDKVGGLLRAGLPGQLHEHVWINFGENRSLSFDECVATAQGLGYALDRTWALLLDADMQLCVNPAFNKEALCETSYNMKQVHHGAFGYYNARLLRLDQPWRCVGVTHEYWEGGCGAAHKMDMLSINDMGDGGCKQDKFGRDARLLSDGLEREPDNTRYMFYLAQTYRDMGQTRQANELYRQHSRSGAWDEERWFSMMQVGLGADTFDDKRAWLLKAYEFRPQRAEPLYHLADICRLGGMHNSAVLFAKAALAIPYPENDVLFISQDVYDYKSLFVLSVSAYYTTFRADGRAACEQLLVMPSLPDDLMATTKKNATFYDIIV